MAYLCYLLRSEVNAMTYVGCTHDVQHRVRQHNGELAGGAHRTTRHRPWRIKLTVEGFQSKHDALSFELAWQKPKVRAPTACRVAVAAASARDHAARCCSHCSHCSRAAPGEVLSAPPRRTRTG